MSIFQNRTDETYENGKLISSTIVSVDVTAPVVELNLHDQADQALANLRTIANGSGAMTAAQLTTAVRSMARILIVLVRLVIRRLDDTT